MKKPKDMTISKLTDAISSCDTWSESASYLKELCKRCHVDYDVYKDTEEIYDDCQSIIYSQKLLDFMDNDELIAEIDRCDDWNEAEDYLNKLCLNCGIDTERLELDDEYEQEIANFLDVHVDEIDSEALYQYCLNNK